MVAAHSSNASSIGGTRARSMTSPASQSALPMRGERRRGGSSPKQLLEVERRKLGWKAFPIDGLDEKRYERLSKRDRELALPQTPGADERGRGADEQQRIGAADEAVDFGLEILAHANGALIEHHLDVQNSLRGGSDAFGPALVGLTAGIAQKDFDVRHEPLPRLSGLIPLSFQHRHPGRAPLRTIRDLITRMFPPAEGALKTLANFRSAVMAGLDPAIQLSLEIPCVFLDGRVAPGHDGRIGGDIRVIRDPGFLQLEPKC